MSEKSKPNLNEMINSAGDGSGLQLPPAFVMVNPKQHRKYKKGNQDKVDGRTKGARSLFDRIQKRKMKEQLETQIDEAIVSDTCLLYTSPSPRDATLSRMPSSA